MTAAIELLQSADSFKELITSTQKDPRVAISMNVAQRLANAWSMYNSHTSLKGIRKQESHKAKIRKIKKILQQKCLNEKIAISSRTKSSASTEETHSEALEKRLTEYASCLFLFEICRVGANQVPIVDVVSIVGAGLLSCAEEKKIQRLQVEDEKEKSGWECAKARYKQAQYALCITSKALFLLSVVALNFSPHEGPQSKEVTEIASKTQNIATVMGVVMTAVTTYENREQITNTLCNVSSYISKKIYSCFTKAKHE